MMYNIPCCGPELGAFALGEEDGLSLVGIEVVVIVVVAIVVVAFVVVFVVVFVAAFVVVAGGGVFLPPSVPVLSASVGEVDVIAINWLVGV